MEVSKANTGNIELEMTELNLMELVKQAVGELSDKFQQRNLTVVANIMEEPAIIQADGRRIVESLGESPGKCVQVFSSGKPGLCGHQKEQPPCGSYHKKCIRESAEHSGGGTDGAGLPGGTPPEPLKEAVWAFP